jgi:hypothetical protein
VTIDRSVAVAGSRPDDAIGTIRPWDGTLCQSGPRSPRRRMVDLHAPAVILDHASTTEATT